MASAPKDVRVVTVAAAIAFLLVAQQVAGKAIRDALFLSSSGPEWLPAAMTLTVLVATGSVLVSSRLTIWLGPRRFLRLGLLVSTLLFAASALRAETAPEDAGWLLYAHIAVFGALISGFWSIVTEALNPTAGRRLIGRVSTGATLGGLSGAGLAKASAALLGSSGCLWVLAAGSVFTIGMSLGLPSTGGQAGAREAESSGGGIAARRYLGGIGLMLFLTALASAFADYVLKAEAAGHYAQEEAALLSFFATFYTVVSLLTVVVQALLSRALLERFGLSAATATLPVSVLGLSVLAFSFGHWLLFVSVRGADSIASNSLFRSGYELLYTPVPRHLKRRYKAIIDVGAIRAGDLLAAGIIFFLGAAAASQPLIVACALLSLLALLVLRDVHKGYVRSLTSQLQAGTVNLTVRDVADLTTLRTLSEVTSSLDRASLLKGIKAFEEMRKQSEPPPRIHSDSTPPEQSKLANYTELSSEQVLAAVPLLGEGDRASLAERAVRHHLRRDRKVLLDLLLDESQPVPSRLALGRLLAERANLWTEEVLLAGLAHKDRGTRDVCAETLARAPELLSKEAARQPILAYAETELAQISVKGDTLRGRLQRILRLLAFGFDRRRVETASRGFFSGDAQLSGSALELISNTVSPEIARQLERCAALLEE